MAPTLAPGLNRHERHMCSDLVGMAGFEPAASCSQSRRANQAAPHPAEPNRSLPPRGARSALRGGNAGHSPVSPPSRASGHVSALLAENRYAVGAHPVLDADGSHRARGRSSMAEPQPSKLVMRVRFPSPAPTRKPRSQS